MDFKIESQNIKYEKVKFSQKEGTVYVSCHGCTDDWEIFTDGILHYEGFIDYKIRVKCSKAFKTDNISLSVYLNNDCAKYMNGLGALGGKSHNLEYKWNSENHHDSLYAGNVNAGLRLKWKAGKIKKQHYLINSLFLLRRKAAR